MMSDISKRLQNLSAVIGLDGKIAKSEMTAVGKELEKLLAYFEEIENGIFLPTSSNEFLNAFQREILPFKDECSAEEMTQKMNMTQNIFNLQFFEDKIKKYGISISYSKEQITLSGIDEKNIYEKSDILNFVKNYSPIHTKIAFSKTGKSWSVFDDLNYNFNIYANTGLSWNMIETI